jgi:threonylcarbamoyladenosine tRNA methylthiotransferase MtaB
VVGNQLSVDGSAVTKPRIAFTTLGCKVNQSESEQMARQFAAAGYECVPFESAADVYVVNTCTVTHVADRKSRQLLNAAQRANPEALIVATGCYASIVGQALAGEQRLIVRNRDKDRVVPLVDGRLRSEGRSVPSVVDSEKYGDSPARDADRARAMVKAQDGCDSHCTYCIIPRARGRSRSVAAERVIERVRVLVQEGHAEVVITGVDLGSYGEDEPSFPDLGGLLQRVLDETEVRRVRVSSLEPGDFDPRWLRLWENPRLCRHLHVPLQAGSAGVLPRMERKYTPDEFAAMVDECRAAIPDVTVTTDVMVGFPGETHDEFGEGLQFIRGIAFDGMHVFKYSQRSGTRASRMPDQVPEEIKAERSALLREESARGVERLHARHRGKRGYVAWESEHDGIRRGLTDTNVRVYGTPADVADGELSVVQLGSEFRDGVWGETIQVELPLIPVS